MGGFKAQYERLWNSLGKRADPQSAIVGGDFEAVGRLEFEFLKMVGLKPECSVIDVGCGSGRLAKQLAPWLQGAYLGTDILAPLLERARGLCARPDWRFEQTDGEH